MIDLMSIARTEAGGGDLFSMFDKMFDVADLRPDGYPDAVVWKGLDSIVSWAGKDSPAEILLRTGAQ